MKLVLRRRRQSGDLKPAGKRRQQSFVYKGLQALETPELSGLKGTCPDEAVTSALRLRPPYCANAGRELLARVATA
jgi:hypothetical protein